MVLLLLRFRQVDSVIQMGKYPLMEAIVTYCSRYQAIVALTHRMISLKRPSLPRQAAQTRQSIFVTPFNKLAQMAGTLLISACPEMMRQPAPHVQVLLH